MDGCGEALVQFGQRRVGLFGDEHHEPVAAFGGHFDRAAGMGFGSEGTGGAAALEQAADPGGADTEELGDLLTGPAFLVAGADDAFAEIL